MRKSKLFNPRTITGLGISCAGIILGFYKFDSQAFLAAIQQTNLLIYICSMIVMILMVVLRAWRWKTLLDPLIPTPLARSFGAEMVGFFGNNVFPFRLGEILRAYALAQIQSSSTSTVFGTIFTERLLDTLMFTVMLIVTALTFPQLPPIIRLTALIAAIVILILTILVYISYVRKEKVKEYLRRQLSLKTNRRVMEVFTNFWRGVNTLRATPHLGLIAIQSFLIWSICLFNTWVSGRAMGIIFDMPTLLLLFFVTNAAISIPSAPGYVGTYHAATIGALVLLGYELARAQALAVVLHSVGFITLTSIGLIYFLKYQVNYKQASLIYAEKGVE